MSRPLVSLSMIVRDEQDTIARALEDAAPICDELVVVDTGSTDATIEIARSFGAQVYEFEWIDDFAAARNFSLDHCHGKWILWLDADDRIPEDAGPGFRSIVELLPSLTDIDVIFLPYQRVFSATDPSRCIYSVDRERLLRNRPGIRWHGKVHETVRFSRGRELARGDAWIEHRPSADHDVMSLRRNLAIIERCLVDGDRSSRMLSYYGRTLAGLDRHEEALAAFEESLVALLSLPGGISHPERAYWHYETLVVMAASAEALNETDRKLEYLERAVATDPKRAEAFIALGQHFYLLQQWHRAAPFFSAVTALHAPERGSLRPPLYSWFAWDCLAICANETGNFQRAIDCTLRALPGHPEKDRLIANLRVYADRLGPAEPT